MISITNLAPLLFRSCVKTTTTTTTTSTRNLTQSTSFCALKTESGGSGSGSSGDYSPDLLKKPLISPSPSPLDVAGQQEEPLEEGYQGEEDDWVDWEDQILEDTVPLVGFVRMLLHSGKYGSGDKLSPEHEKTILERVLPYHPEFEKKIGCGIDYIKVDFHPDFEDSRCLFIVRKDGQSVDFSYWKCIKGLIKRNYPLYANSFILRHFRRASGRNA